MSSLIDVWRYENSEGNGPYNDDFSEGHKMAVAHEDRRHPSPNEEWDIDTFLSFDRLNSDELFMGRLGFSDKPGQALFALDTREHLIEWFKGYNEKLQSEGWTIHHYRVPAKDVLCGTSGNHQLAFRRKHAKLVTE